MGSNAMYGWAAELETSSAVRGESEEE